MIVRLRRILARLRRLEWFTAVRETTVPGMVVAVASVGVTCPIVAGLSGFVAGFDPGMRMKIAGPGSLHCVEAAVSQERQCPVKGDQESCRRDMHATNLFLKANIGPRSSIIGVFPVNRQELVCRS